MGKVVLHKPQANHTKVIVGRVNWPRPLNIQRGEKGQHDFEASHNGLTFSPEALMSPCTLTFAFFICWLKRSLVLICSVIHFSFLEVVSFNIDINFEHFYTVSS